MKLYSNQLVSMAYNIFYYPISTKSPVLSCYYSSSRMGMPAKLCRGQCFAVSGQLTVAEPAGCPSLLLGLAGFTQEELLWEGLLEARSLEKPYSLRPLRVGAISSTFPSFQFLAQFGAHSRCSWNTNCSRNSLNQFWIPRISMMKW